MEDFLVKIGMQQTFKVGKRKIAVEVYDDEVVASIAGEAIVNAEYAGAGLAETIVSTVQAVVEVATDLEQARVDAAREEADRRRERERAFEDARRTLGA